MSRSQCKQIQKKQKITATDGELRRKRRCNENWDEKKPERKEIYWTVYVVQIMASIWFDLLFPKGIL